MFMDRLLNGAGTTPLHELVQVGTGDENWSHELLHATLSSAPCCCTADFLRKISSKFFKHPNLDARLRGDGRREFVA